MFVWLKRVTDWLIVVYCLLFACLVAWPDLAQPLNGYTCAENFERTPRFLKLSEAIKKTRLHFDATDEDLTASGRVVLLFIMHLFLGLPNLIPKSTIEYQAMLGETLVKSIQLQNPSKKRVIYEVTMEGSSNFTTETKHIILPPESFADVPVSFRANFSDPVQGVISFWGVREGGAAGTSMVFNLSAVITGRIPVEVIRRSVALFELDKFSVTFKSQFDKTGTFPLVMTVEHDPLSIEDAIKGTAPKKKKKTLSSFAFAEAAPAQDKSKTEEDIEAERLFKVCGLIRSAT